MGVTERHNQEQLASAWFGMAVLGTYMNDKRSKVRCIWILMMGMAGVSIALTIRRCIEYSIRIFRKEKGEGEQAEG